MPLLVVLEPRTTMIQIPEDAQADSVPLYKSWETFRNCSAQSKLFGLDCSTLLEYSDHSAHRRFERLGFDFVHWGRVFKAGKESLCNAAALSVAAAASTANSSCSFARRKLG